MGVPISQLRKLRLRELTYLPETPPPHRQPHSHVRLCPWMREPRPSPRGESLWCLAPWQTGPVTAPPCPSGGRWNLSLRASHPGRNWRREEVPMDGSGGSPSPLLHTHQSQDNSKVNHRASAWTHIGMGGLGAAFHPGAPPRLAHHPGAPLSWEGSRSGSGRWLRGQVTGLPPEQAPRSARNLRVPVQVSVGTEIFREMTGRSAGAGGRRARPGLGWEAGRGAAPMGVAARVAGPGALRGGGRRGGRGLTVQPPPSVRMSQYTWKPVGSCVGKTEYTPSSCCPPSRTSRQSRGREPAAGTAVRVAGPPPGPPPGPLCPRGSPTSLSATPRVGLGEWHPLCALLSSSGKWAQ